MTHRGHREPWQDGWSAKWIVWKAIGPVWARAKGQMWGLGGCQARVYISVVGLYTKLHRRGWDPLKCHRVQSSNGFKL